MNKPTHILIVEDLTTDAELAMRMIRKVLKDCEFQVVETRQDFLHELETFQPDVILSDYTLPHFDGMQALKLAQKHAPLTPLIIWTGSISEDVAVACMKAGANNYVLKSNFKRLGPAVLHALEERELLVQRKQAEENLRERERQLNILFSNLPGPVYRCSNDADYTMEFISDGIRELSGYPAEDFRQHRRQFGKLIHPDDRAYVDREIQTAVDNDQPFEMVYRLLTANGEEKWVWEKGQAVRDAEGRLQALEGFITDVTQRKQAEEALRESENRLILALSGAQMSVWEWNLQTNQILWSPEIFEITGVNESDLGATFESFTHLIHPEDIARVMSAAQKAMNERTLFAEEFRIIRPDGEVRWLSNLGHAEYDATWDHLRLIGTVQDITQRKQVQLERQALLGIMQDFANTRDLHELLKLIHNSIASVIYAENFFVALYQPNSGLFEEIYTADQYDQACPPSKMEKSLTAYVFHTGEPLLLERGKFAELAAREEVRLIGTPAASWLGVPLRIADRIIGVMAVQDYENPDRYSERDRDFLASIATQIAIAIEHREAGIALRESEEHYRAIFEGVQDAIFVESLDGRILMVNERACEMFGYTRTEFLTKTVADLVPQGHQILTAEEIDAGLASKPRETFNQRASGEVFPIEISGRMQVINGQTIVLVVVRDVTERKQAEAALLESVTQFRTLFAASPDAIILIDQRDNWPILDCNTAACQMNGYTREELIGQPISILNAEPSTPEHRVDYLNRIREMGVYRMETTHRRKDGTIFPVDVSTSLLTLGGREVVLGIDRDITERKRAEQALLESMAQFRTLFEASPEAIMLLDPADNWSIVDCNTAACQMNGYGREELIGQCIDILNLTPGTSEERAEYMARVQAQDIVRYETAHRRKDGTIIAVEVSTTLIRFGTRDIVLGIDRDITERKRAENELRFEKERFEKIAATVPGIICSFRLHPDGSTSMPFASSAIQDVYGVQPADVQDDAATLFAHIHPDDVHHVREAVAESAQTMQPWHCEFRYRHPTKGEIWIEGRAMPLREPDGSTIWHGFIYDITERRRAESELRASEERFRQLADNIQEVFWMTDAESDRVLYISPAAESVWGYPVGRLMQGTNIFFASILPEDRAAAHSAIDREKHGEKAEVEYRILHPDGSIRWIWDRGFPIFDDAGNVKRLAGISADITERKQAQQALLKQEQQLEEAQRLGHIGGWELEIPTAAMTWSAEMYHLYDRDPKSPPLDFEQHTSMIHPDDKERVLQIMREIRAIRQSFSFDYRILIGDGKIRWLHTRGEILEDTAGQPVRIRGIAQDITQQKQNEMEIRRHMAELEALYENGLAVGRLLKPGEIGNRVIETFARYLPWHHVTIRLRQEGSDNLELVAFNLPSLQAEERTNAEQHFIARINKVGQGLSGWVIQTGMPLRTGDVHAHPQYIDTHTGIQSGLYMPLKVGEQVIGVISVESELPDAFTEQDERLLATLANQAAIAFENARLYEAVHVELAERKRAEEALRASETHYRELADSITDILFEMDQDLRFTHWNKALETLVGVPAEEAIGKTLRDMFGEREEQARIDQVFEQVLRDHQSRTFELAFMLNESQHSYEISAYPSTSGVSVVAKDVSERKQMELALEAERNQLARRVEERTADLRQANLKLERALRVKDEFLANMSHELRTPLNAILGLSESLGEQIAGPLNQKQQKYITTISESGHHLLSLINDILDLAKIEAGQITLDINKVDIRSVCQSSLRMIKQLAQKKNQEVSLEIDPDLGLMWADERRLKQMIVNLLGNAVKFTPEGGRLGLEIHGDRDANQVRLTVWDRGIGIQEADLPRLFKPFVQLDSGLTRGAAGTGLGLALVAEMARLHGGSISAESELDKGSRFTIVLPWEPALAAETVEKLRNTGKFRAIQFDHKPVILLVEDTLDVIMMFQDYLQLAGYEVVTACDGVEALAQARRTHPDLILMDVQLPRMDGLEVTKALRGEPDFRYTPIIALTALAMPSDRERCLAAGMDEYLSKPINLKAMLKLIQNFLFNRKASGPQ